MTATKRRPNIRVVYWDGPNQTSRECNTYRQSLAIAQRNSNSHDAKFFEIATGKQLHDDGNGLRYADAAVYVC